jgi:hypothetical protein
MPFIELKQLPLGGIPIQVRHPFPHQRGRSRRDKHLQTLDQNIAGLRLSANIEPQNAEGQRRVNRGLRFLCIHSKYRKGRAPLPHQASRINGPKGFLQIHTGRQPHDLELGKVTFQRPAQLLLIRGARRSSSRWSTPVTLAANLQLRGPRLSQPLHREPQSAVLDLGLQHAPHGIALRRPQVQQAPVVLA